MFGFFFRFSSFFRNHAKQESKKNVSTAAKINLSNLFFVHRRRKTFFQTNFLLRFLFFFSLGWNEEEKDFLDYWRWRWTLVVGVFIPSRLLVGLTAATKLIDDGSRRILAHPTLTLSHTLSLTLSHARTHTHTLSTYHTLSLSLARKIHLLLLFNLFVYSRSLT